MRIETRITATLGPTSFGNWDSVLYAFDGDLRFTRAREHRVGGAWAGTPSTGWTVRPEMCASAAYLDVDQSFGHNQSVSSSSGRTGVYRHYTKVYQRGQGDAGGYFVSGYATGVKTGSESYLANSALNAYIGNFTAGADGTYLNPYEFLNDDGGFDAAGAGYVIKHRRTKDDGAKLAWWFGFRSQTEPDCTKPINVHYSAYGKAKVGYDASLMDLDTNQAAHALKSGQRCYGDASSSDWRYADILGDAYWTYEAAQASWRFTKGIDSEGGLKANTVTKTSADSPYTILSSDFTVRCNAVSGAITVALPAAASCPRKILNIKKVDTSANSVTIDASGSETIDGQLTQTIATAFESLQLQSNGTSWDII
jgi:hypothetical protein